ncbi:MAG: general secretion pathway protein GspK [Lentisphaerae bacterium]|nr:general secretion pathway protein GspK [Lentisphaerota bacterium]
MTRRRQSGSILVLTLWLAAGLAAAALLTGHATVLRQRRAADATAALAAEHAVEGVLRYVIEVLAAAPRQDELPEAGTYEAADIEVGGCRVWLLGEDHDLDDSEPSFGLQDEAGRLNLNSAPLEWLEALPGMTAELAAAIVDWRDSDAEPLPNGAESETYLALDPAYVAKDAPFESVGEMHLLNGADRRLFQGLDRNRNGLLEAWERDLQEDGAGRFEDTPDRGLMALLTVHSRAAASAGAGSEAPVDLNGDANAVRRLLNELFGERAVAIAGAAGVGTSRFDSVLAFCLRGGLDDAEAERLWDRVTVGDRAATSPLNVATATAAALACLPGVGPDRAEDLVAYRESHAGTMRTPLWLATALDTDTALAAGPQVTARSWQVAADIVAVSPSGRAFRRVRYVLDRRQDRPVVVSRRDLTHLGWPLGEALRRETMTISREDS